MCSTHNLYAYIQVKVEYIGDLATTVHSHNLQSRYLLVPALDEVSKEYRREGLYRNMTVSACAIDIVCVCGGGGGEGRRKELLVCS